MPPLREKKFGKNQGIFARSAVLRSDGMSNTMTKSVTGLSEQVT